MRRLDQDQLKAALRWKVTGLTSGAFAIPIQFTKPLHLSVEGRIDVPIRA
jgi:hypothetical protein